MGASVSGTDEGKRDILQTLVITVWWRDACLPVGETIIEDSRESFVRHISFGALLTASPTSRTTIEKEMRSWPSGLGTVAGVGWPHAFAL